MRTTLTILHHMKYHVQKKKTTVPLYIIWSPPHNKMLVYFVFCIYTFWCVLKWVTSDSMILNVYLGVMIQLDLIYETKLCKIKINV